MIYRNKGVGMSLSEELKTIRLSQYLSQADFANKIGVSFVSVNRWENGKAKPNMKAMKSIIEFSKLNNIDSSKIEQLWKD